MSKRTITQLPTILNVNPDMLFISDYDSTTWNVSLTQLNDYYSTSGILNEYATTSWVESNYITINDFDNATTGISLSLSNLQTQIDENVIEIDINKQDIITNNLAIQDLQNVDINLQTEIDATNLSISNISSNILTINTEIIDIQSDIVDLNNNLNIVENDIVALQNTDTNFNIRIGNNETNIGNISNSVNNLDNDVDALSVTVNTFNSRITNLEITDTTHTNNIATLTLTTGNNTSQINNLISDVNVLENIDLSHNARLNSLENIYINVLNDISGLESDVSNLQTQDVNFNNRINTLENSDYVDQTFTDANYTTITTFNTYKTSNDASILSLQNNDISLDNRIDALELSNTTLIPSVNTNTSNITSLQTLTNTHTTQIGNLVNTDITLNNSITTINNNINTIQNDINTINNDINAIEGNVSNLDTITTLHTSQITSLQNAIISPTTSISETFNLTDIENNQTLGNNTMYVGLFKAQKGTYNTLQFYIPTLTGTGSSIFRIGIYNSSQNLLAKANFNCLSTTTLGIQTVALNTPIVLTQDSYLYLHFGKNNTVGTNNVSSYNGVFNSVSNFGIGFTYTLTDGNEAPASLTAVSKTTTTICIYASLSNI